MAEEMDKLVSGGGSLRGGGGGGGGVQKTFPLRNGLY